MNIKELTFEERLELLTYIDDSKRVISACAEKGITLKELLAIRKLHKEDGGDKQDEAIDVTQLSTRQREIYVLKASKFPSFYKAAESLGVSSYLLGIWADEFKRGSTKHSSTSKQDRFPEIAEESRINSLSLVNRKVSSIARLVSLGTIPSAYELKKWSKDLNIPLILTTNLNK